MLRGTLTSSFLRMCHVHSTTSSFPASRTSTTLPRLPVPELHKTMERYLMSLQPFLLEDERQGKNSYCSSYALRLEYVQAFVSGIGRVLQDRLIALDRASPNNWLDDNIWIYKAYLEWRAPLLINSNWWLAFHDDDNINPSTIPKTSDHICGITVWQIRRASWLVHRVLDFKARLVSQDIHPETTRTGIWIQENTAKLFGIARIPVPHRDILSSPPDSLSPDSLKVLLMIHNWCYAISVYYPPNSSNTKPQLLRPPEIERRIRGAVFDVKKRLSDGEEPLLIGGLSADHRDRWTENQRYLLSLSSKNQKTYETMIKSVMALSLDHITHIIPSLPRKPYDPRNVSQQTLDSHLHTIRSHPLNYSNRFYDKPFTLIVDPSSRAGATGEHSTCDALVPSIVAEYAVIQGIDKMAFSFSFSDSEATSDGWERLDWFADDNIQSECVAAQSRALELIKNSDDSVLWFEGYGVDWIKDIAKLSPDAYIQMALQLAWFKTRGEFTATYETVLTRMFKHGRTETLRTFTRDSRTWVLTMVNSKATTIVRCLSLKQAIATHCKLTKEAATGRGIDRHLLGLRLMLRPEDGEYSNLFEDELFERSQCWKLSTSGLSAGHLFRGTGFGAMYDDGYGINYLAGPDVIKFGIESKYCSPLTSTETFKQAIVESLYDMQALFIHPQISAFSLDSHL